MPPCLVAAGPNQAWKSPTSFAAKPFAYLQDSWLSDSRSAGSGRFAAILRLPHRRHGRTRPVAVTSAGTERSEDNSCRNRHCPKCLGLGPCQVARKTCGRTVADPLLPRGLHAPQPKLPLFLYRISGCSMGCCLRRPARHSVEVAASPLHLGAQEIGLLAVLHTWGQNLTHHPHLHCVVSGGGLSQDGTHWIASRKHYFLPVRVLSRVFRNKFRALLQRAFQRGELEFFGELQPLADPALLGGF